MTQDLALRCDARAAHNCEREKANVLLHDAGQRIATHEWKRFLLLRSSALQLLRRTNQISRPQFCTALHRNATQGLASYCEPGLTSLEPGES